MGIFKIMDINIEERKRKEIEYYEAQAKRWPKEATNERWKGDFEGFNPQVLLSFRFFYKLLAKHALGKKVLDYGCGNGIHSIFPAKQGAEVIGIDLSEPSLHIASERARKEGVGNKVSFIAMDCESLTFPDNSFDTIMDGGTFSSLDVQKALPELARVLKPDGAVIGIETLGHNPFTNFKRILNKRAGKRTEWAAKHIFTMQDLERAKHYFTNVEAHFFHVISWAAFPFLRLAGGKFLLQLLEGADQLLLLFPFLRRYAFKVVFIFSAPKKP